MSDVELSVDNSALICLHFQNDIVHEQGRLAFRGFGAMVKKNGVIAKVRRLHDAARKAQIPILHVRIVTGPQFSNMPKNCKLFTEGRERKAMDDGTWGAEFHDELKPQESEIIVDATRVSGFCGTKLELNLSSVRAHNLVFAGVATNIAVEGSAREASDRGYNVFVVEDCCASNDQQMHDFAVQRILPMLTTVTNLDAVVKAWS